MTREEEIKLIENDDSNFANTKAYLDGFILALMKRRDIPMLAYDDLHQTILGDVPRAAKRFLQHARRGAAFRLSTYFAWYVLKRIRPYGQLKKAA